MDQVFAWILDAVAKAGYLSPKAVFIDGTYIKANADREAHGKKPFDNDNDPPAPTKRHKDNTSKKKLARRKKQGFRTVTKSATDPDCGLFVKGGHERRKYVYDEFYDCALCPEYQPLKYSTTNRDGYREYKSDPTICANCPTRELCTHSKDCVKTVQRHIRKDYEELADDARYTPEYRELYKRRKETIERVFADAKEKHAMRYTQYRGLAQVTNRVKLKFAAMNLKKLATWKWRDLLPSFRFAIFSLIYVRDPVCLRLQSRFLDRLNISANCNNKLDTLW